MGSLLLWGLIKLIRPVSIIRPTAATAITATTVATVPSRVPWSQFTADTITPEPAGLPAMSCADADPEIPVKAKHVSARFTAPKRFKACTESP